MLTCNVWCWILYWLFNSCSLLLSWTSSRLAAWSWCVSRAFCDANSSTSTFFSRSLCRTDDSYKREQKQQQIRSNIDHFMRIKCTLSKIVKTDWWMKEIKYRKFAAKVINRFIATFDSQKNDRLNIVIKNNSSEESEKWISIVTCETIDCAQGFV